MNSKKSRKIKVNKLKYIFTVFLILSALFTSIIPVYAEGVTKPSVSKPSVGSASNKTEDKYAEDDVGFLESLFEEEETERIITDKEETGSVFGSLFENTEKTDEEIAEENSGTETAGSMLTGTMLSMFLSIARIVGVLCLAFGLISLIRSIFLDDADGKGRAVVMSVAGVALSALKSVVSILVQVA